MKRAFLKCCFLFVPGEYHIDPTVAYIALLHVAAVGKYRVFLLPSEPCDVGSMSVSVFEVSGKTVQHCALIVAFAACHGKTRSSGKN
jgi:hypothetical protein